MSETVLVAAFGDAGHAFPALALAGELHRRGHEVVIETWEKWREPAEALGLRFQAAEEYVVFPPPPPGEGPGAADAAVATRGKTITLATVESTVDKAAVRYDRDGDQHYDVISAFIKSMRGSDVDAALHYLARMIAAGEDPRFIARRIVIAAAEEVGMADPSALQTAVAAAQAVALIGMPEARIILAEAVVHVTTAPKSNASYRGIDAALADVRAGRIGTVPIHLRDAHYAGARPLGHGQDYRYAHDEPHAVAAQQYLPDELVGTRYYTPSDRGYERSVTERLDRIRAILSSGEGKIAATDR